MEFMAWLALLLFLILNGWFVEQICLIAHAKTRSHSSNIRAVFMKSCFDLQTIFHKHVISLGRRQLYNVTEDKESYIHSFTPKWHADLKLMARSSRLPSTRQHSWLAYKYSLKFIPIPKLYPD